MTATQTQLRRDTATNLNAATPAAGELGVDTTNNQLRLGDGTTAGGIRIPNALNVQNQSFAAVDAGGTADALTLTLAPAPAAYAAYQRFTFKAASDNATTTPTINVNSLGAKTMKKKTSAGVSALAAGDIKSGCIYSGVYDGTYVQIEAVPSGAGGAIETQTFTGNGTWTKPGSGTVAFIRVWGGGGSGGSSNAAGAEGGGGGGGAYSEAWIPLASLSATETVTVGNGGTGVTAGNGNAGGTSSFGAYVSAFGGGGGGSSINAGAGGGGGGMQGAGTSGSATTAGAGGNPLGGAAGSASAGGDSLFGGGGGGANALNYAGGNSIYGGGGGGGAKDSSGDAGDGGNSVYGGGGGGGGSNGGTAGTGGTSSSGGAGGNGAADAAAPQAGAVPGGGGGGCEQNTSGAGGNGKVVVIVF